MSDLRAPESQGSGARARFRGWRRSRPFWGGIFAIAGGIELYSVTAAPLSVVVMQGLPGLATLTISTLSLILGVVTWVQPHLRTVTGWVIIVMGIISILVSNLGGFLFGMILLVVGGSLILAWMPPAYEDEYDEDDYYDGDEYDDEYDEGAYDEETPAEQDGSRQNRASEVERTRAYAEASDDAPARKGGPVRLAGTFIKRHGFKGVKGFIKGNPRRTVSERPAPGPDAGRSQRLVPARPRRLFGATNGPSLRAVTAIVLPVTLLTFGAQLAVAGPASAATGSVQTAAAPDWWPFDWWPGDDGTTTPPPGDTTPTTETPTTPADGDPATSTDPEAPAQGGPILPGTVLPPATPDADTPEEQQAAKDAAAAIAEKNCEEARKQLPAQLPKLGSGGAEIAAAVVNACITSNVRRDNVPTPADTDTVVSPDDSTMVASKLVMTGFSYDGVQTLKTRTGKKRVLAFSADTLAVSGYDQAFKFKGGVITNTNPDTDVMITQKVKLYVSSMKGNIFGLVPLTFTPDSPPPLVLPYMLITDTTSQVALVESGQIKLDNLTIRVK